MKRRESKPKPSRERQRIHVEKLPAEGESTLLPSSQQHHLMHVLRAETGDEIELFDGLGLCARAELHVEGGLVSAHVIQLSHAKPSSRITLAFGYPKGQAVDFIFRRVTELGVRAFQPLETAHSLRSTQWNAGRWARVIAEVGKQCQESALPRVLQPLNLKDWLALVDKQPLVVCDEQRRETLPLQLPPKAEIHLLVGPEGGWSPEERACFQKHGASWLGLGKNRLRTETSCLTAVALLKRDIGEL